MAAPSNAPKPAAGLEFPDAPGLAVENVTILWRGDLTSQQPLEHDPIVPAAWNDAPLRWLVSPGQ
jgi:hypothetical protein